jgi:cell division protein FtsI/penicillin-binding protein 2
MSKGFASNYRIFLLSAGVFVCLAGIGTRLVFLHVIDRGKLLQYIGQVRRQVIVEPARRGVIYDTHQHLLAANQSMYNVGVDPQALRPEDRQKWPELAALVNIPLAKLERLMTTKTRQVRVNAPAGSEKTPAPVGVVFNITPIPAASVSDELEEESVELDDSDETLTERPLC